MAFPNIQIPFNEYIFGSFEDKKVNHHFYSFYIYNETNKIFLQLRQRNIDVFIEEGKSIFNTNEDDLEKIQIQYGEFIDNLNISQYKNKFITLAFRSQYNFSFYYFRIFQLKKNDILIYPLDSNFGNICKPEQFNFKAYTQNSNYYCYFLLKNEYNEFSQNFSITTSKLGNSPLINANIIPKSNKLQIDQKYFNYFIKNNNFPIQRRDNKEKSKYINYFNQNNVSYILFFIEFSSKFQENILSTFYDIRKDIYPNIYSSKIYQLGSIDRILKFNLKKNYSLIIKWINGTGEIYNFNSFNFSINEYKRDDHLILTSIIKDNIININSSNQLIFYIKMNYLSKNTGIRLSQLSYNFPTNEIINTKTIYYCYISFKNNSSKVVNETVNINFKMKPFNNELDLNFTIESELTDYENIKKITSNEPYKFSNKKIDGKYDKYSKNGFLEIPLNEINVQNTSINSEKCILIKITNSQFSSNQNILIQIIAIKLNDNRITIPINQYIYGSLNSIDNKEITLYLNKNRSKKKYISIEFSTNYKGIKLNISNYSKIYNKNDSSEIKKYIISSSVINYITINFINPIKNKNLFPGYYMLKYNYITEKNSELKYKFNKTCNDSFLKKKEDNNYTITYEFNNLQIIGKYDFNIKFDIYCTLFLKENIKEELLTFLSFISTNSSYENNTNTIPKDKKFNITFDSISKNDINKEYIMQIKFIINKENENFVNEILVFTKDIFLQEKKLEKNNINNFSISLILSISIFVNIIIVIIIFIKKYRDLNEKNLKLIERVNFISFSQTHEEDNDSTVLFI